MLTPTRGAIVRKTPQLQYRLVALYAVALLLLFHSNVTIYVNSSYLANFLASAEVGIVFTVGSAIALLIFLFISRVLHRLGNYKLTMGLLFFDLLAVLGMAFVADPRVVIPLFLVHFITLPLLFFNIDVFIEAELDNKELSTGSKRGLLLTLTGLVGAIAPLIMGISVPDSQDFTIVYILSAVALLPVIAIVAINLKQFIDPPYVELDVMDAISSFWERRNIRIVFIATVFLQLFFTFTVIYYPIFLIDYIGLTWEGFGIIMAIGVLAYVIFEYPVGILADNYLGEKEMMALGFMILAIAISATAYMTTTNLIIWSVVMFVMRIGASLVEVTTESYFFKKTRSSDAQVISFFRATRPFAYIITTVCASFLLLFIPFNLLFVTAAMAMLPVMLLVTRLEDTK